MRLAVSDHCEHMEGFEMNEGKWTKGPWKAEAYNTRMGTLVSFGDISKGETIGNIFAQKDVAEGIANGQLSAAAPELFEALDEMLAAFGEVEVNAAQCRAYHKARSAYSKALGKATL